MQGRRLNPLLLVMSQSSYRILYPAKMVGCVGIAPTYRGFQARANLSQLTSHEFSLADLNGTPTMCAQRREVSVSLGKVVPAATVRVAINSERTRWQNWLVRRVTLSLPEIWSFS